MLINGHAKAEAERARSPVCRYRKVSEGGLSIQQKARLKKAAINPLQPHFTCRSLDLPILRAHSGQGKTSGDGGGAGLPER